MTTSHFKTPSIISDEMAEHAQSASEAIDAATQKVLDEGRAAATNGVAAFDKWWKWLNAPDAYRITSQQHAAMRKVAAEADAAGQA